jgi:hypothetical protein
MIILVWASERAEEFGKKIEAAFQQPVKAVSTLQEGCRRLQGGSSLRCCWTRELRNANRERPTN